MSRVEYFICDFCKMKLNSNEINLETTFELDIHREGGSYTYHTEKKALFDGALSVFLSILPSENICKSCIEYIVIEGLKAEFKERQW